MLELFTVENLLALLTLTALEVVLGIDNIVFIAILSGKLPPERRNAARKLGLIAAMGMRIVLLLGIGWVSRATNDWLKFSVLGQDFAFSWRDIILLVGGLFLIAKATHEIHNKLEGDEPEDGVGRRAATMGSVIVQIMLMDIIFSLDSVITAVGMVDQHEGREWQAFTIMITAVIVAVLVMLWFARPISEFVERHPTIKMLGLSFLLLIGVMLMAEGFGAHVSKGYIYFAMGFSLFVELLNLRMRKVSKPVHIHQPHLPKES
ncbi:MAG: TerC family protein [Phycisphaerales bacterium]|nr:TerC family protein [Phycisphaerales bacterium]MCI0674342.1 TerC family protein [Phycisphaerales bacterium]